MKGRSFLPLFVTNFLGVVNDNFLKTLASFVIIGWLGGDEKLAATFMGATAAALVLPYILLSPLADRLTIIVEKKWVVRLAKWAELPVVAIAVIGFWFESIPLVIASILALGVQSSLYSPAKYALVRDIGGEERISTGMGGMEGVSFAAVLVGMIAAALVSDHHGVWVWSAIMVGLAALGLVGSYTIRADEERNRNIHAINPFRYMARAYRMARRYNGLNAVIFTLSVFWFAAAMLQQGLVVYGKEVMKLSSTETGGILAVAAVGIVIGQVLAGFVDRRRFLLGGTLLTGWIAAAILAVLFFVRLSPVAFTVLLGVLAFDMGFFKLPFDAEIQKVVKGPKLNTMLAYFNQVSFLFMFAASVCYIGVSWLFGSAAFLALLAVVLAVVPVLFVFSYRSVLCRTGGWFFFRRYRVRTSGMELFERQGTSNLVLPNHVAIVDPMLIVAQLWRYQICALCDELYFDRGGISGHVLRVVGAIRVPDLRKHRSAEGAKVARGLQDVVTGSLAEGRNVIFYPSGHICTEPREDIGTRQLAYNVCRELPPGARVIGVRHRGLWGSIWSRKGRRTSPPFATTLLKSLALWPLCLVTFRRRDVDMHFEDITDRVREWSSLTRLEFNRKLEEWYNQG